MLDGELSQLEQRMVAAHLERCADCRTFERTVSDFTHEDARGSARVAAASRWSSRAGHVVPFSASRTSASQPCWRWPCSASSAQLGPTGLRARTSATRLTTATLFTARLEARARDRPDRREPGHPDQPGAASRRSRPTPLGERAERLLELARACDARCARLRGAELAAAAALELAVRDDVQRPPEPPVAPRFASRAGDRRTRG